MQKTLGLCKYAKQGLGWLYFALDFAKMCEQQIDTKAVDWFMCIYFNIGVTFYGAMLSLISGNSVFVAIGNYYYCCNLVC